MRARSAEEQIADRRRVARPAELRPRDEQLIERQLAVEDVAAGQDRSVRSRSSGVITSRATIDDSNRGA